MGGDLHDRAGHDDIASGPGAALGRTLPRRALVRGSPVEGLGATGQGPDPLLAGPDGEPGVHLAGGGGRGSQPQRVPGVDDSVVLDRLHLGRCEPLLERRKSGGIGFLAGDGLRQVRRRPLRLGHRRPGCGTELAELLGDCGHPGVGLVQDGECRLDPLGGGLPHLRDPGQLETCALGAVVGRTELVGGLVDGRLDLEEGG